MSYATPYHIRYYQNPKAVQTKTITQTVGRVCRLDAKTKGCERSTERQTEIRTYSNAANGFLNCSFLPKLNTPEPVPVCKKSAKTEKDFYQSLSQLAAHYSIESMQSVQYGYPYNIALALDDVQEQLKSKVNNWDAIQLLQDSKKTYFISDERYNTGATLYYIPIVPLYRLSKNPKRKQAVQLLQSVYTYFYHIAKVPYYRQENSYLYWIYEMVAEWILCDDPNEDTPSYINEIKQAAWIGERMEQKIHNANNLTRFKERLDSFKTKDSFDNDCLLLASKVYELYQQYSNTVIYRNARLTAETSDDENENTITMDKYISFCADAKGLLFQSIFESVNNELQEYTETDEPTIVKYFEGSNLTDHTLDFENRIFPLIEELIDILNNF